MYNQEVNVVCIPESMGTSQASVDILVFASWFPYLLAL